MLVFVLLLVVVADGGHRRRRLRPVRSAPEDPQRPALLRRGPSPARGRGHRCEEAGDREDAGASCEAKQMVFGAVEGRITCRLKLNVS